MLHKIEHKIVEVGCHSKINMNAPTYVTLFDTNDNCRRLESSLESLGWPNVINTSTKMSDQLATFRSAFSEMLLLHPP